MIRVIHSLGVRMSRAARFSSSVSSDADDLPSALTALSIVSASGCR